MTIYITFKGGTASKRRRKMYQQVHHQRNRAGFAFYQQWKRYPNGRAVTDIRSGAKTHSWIYPEGYDPYFGPIASGVFLLAQGNRHES